MCFSFDEKNTHKRPRSLLSLSLARFSPLSLSFLPLSLSRGVFVLSLSAVPCCGAGECRRACMCDATEATAARRPHSILASFFIPPRPTKALLAADFARLRPASLLSPSLSDRGCSIRALFLPLLDAVYPRLERVYTSRREVVYHLSISTSHRRVRKKQTSREKWLPRTLRRWPRQTSPCRTW